MGVFNGLSRMFSRSSSGRSSGGAQDGAAVADAVPPARPSVLPEKPVEVPVQGPIEAQVAEPARSLADPDASAQEDADLEPITDDAIYEPTESDATPNGTVDATPPMEVLDIDPDQSDGAESALLDRAADALSPKRPRNKRELIDELRRNYDEVLGLVRKMDTHLDAERQRGDRLLEIAERIAPAVAVLPELRQQNARMTDAMERLAESTDRAAGRSEQQRAEIAREHREALDQVRETVSKSESVGERVAGTLGEFKQAVEDVATRNETLGEAVIKSQAASDQRERELADTIAGAQRWMVTAVSICGAMVVLAVIITLTLVL
ncbi:MAG: hypothetical protein AAGK04_03665 [Planctomycetota bacterium]